MNRKDRVTLELNNMMNDGHQICAQKKGNERPGYETGDILFTIRLKDHATYRKQGNDLYTEQSISLTDALSGFDLKLKHLDGKMLNLEMREIISPGDVQVLRGVGFNPKGDLYVKFNITFPKGNILPKTKVAKLLGQ